MSELVNIITTADVTARLSTSAHTRLFAKNGGGSSAVDTVFRDLCIAQANSEIRTLTRAAFPSGLYADGDTLDPEVVGKGVWLVCAIAASYHLTADETSGYAANGNRARDFFKSINRDADARVPGASNPVPQPRAALTLATNAVGVPNDPYGRIASGTDQGGF